MYIDVISALIGFLFSCAAQLFGVLTNDPLIGSFVILPVVAYIFIYVLNSFKSSGDKKE